MAASFAAAFAQVEGPEFDRAVGYFIPPRKHAPVDGKVIAALRGFDSSHFDRIIQMLGRRYRCHEAYAEDAVQDTLLDLFDKRPGLFRSDPMGWLGLLYSASRFRLVDDRALSGRTQSIEGLRDSVGDRVLAAARPCVPLSPASDDEARYAPLPLRGEAWTRTQIVGALQRFGEYYGHPPKAVECRSVHQLPSHATICRHFGSLANALLAAGMVPETIGRRRRRWSAIEAARACLFFRRRNGRWPDWSDVRRSRGELPGTAVMNRFFGGTRSAQVQIGAESILSGP
jgi:DNA-directed RNA polymerase specialized sigma24 family protein